MRLVRTLVGGAPSRGRFGCEASSMARSSVAAGGGGKRGGERRALHDPIDLTIVAALPLTATPPISIDSLLHVHKAVKKDRACASE